MRKLVKIEDVEMADVGAEMETRKTMVKSMAMTMTRKTTTTTPALPLPQPSTHPTLILPFPSRLTFVPSCISTHSKTTTRPPKALPSPLPSVFYPGVSLHRTTLKLCPKTLHLIIYPFQLVPARLIVIGDTYRFFHAPETKHSKWCTCASHARPSRLMTGIDAGLCEGICGSGRSWPLWRL
jgi:hypothetical protein